MVAIVFLKMLCVHLGEIRTFPAKRYKLYVSSKIYLHRHKYHTLIYTGFLPLLFFEICSVITISPEDCDNLFVASYPNPYL